MPQMSAIPWTFLFIFITVFLFFYIIIIYYWPVSESQKAFNNKYLKPKDGNHWW